jgi:hypothetical protein
MLSALFLLRLSYLGAMEVLDQEWQTGACGSGPARSHSDNFACICNNRGKVKLSVCLTKHYAIKAYGGLGVYIHVFLTSALVGREWSASLPLRFTPRQEAPGTHWIRGWMGPRTGFDVTEKRKNILLSGFEPPSIPFVYRLSYPF